MKKINELTTEAGKHLTTSEKPLRTYSENKTSAENEFFKDVLDSMAAIMPSMKNNEFKTGTSQYGARLVQMLIEKGVNKQSQIEQGLDRLADWSVKNDFAPPLARFVMWCQLDPKDSDLPSPEVAYRHAVHKEWGRHKAVWHAYNRVGSYEWYNSPEKRVKAAFLAEYEIVCDRVLNGFYLSEPIEATDKMLESKPKEKTPMTDEEKEAARKEFDEIKAKLRS